VVKVFDIINEDSFEDPKSPGFQEYHRQLTQQVAEYERQVVKVNNVIGQIQNSIDECLTIWEWTSRGMSNPSTASYRDMQRFRTIRRKEIDHLVAGRKVLIWGTDNTLGSKLTGYICPNTPENAEHLAAIEKQTAKRDRLLKSAEILRKKLIDLTVNTFGTKPK
jgi:hypothetical protein